MPADPSVGPTIWVRFSKGGLEIEGAKEALFWLANAVSGPPARSDLRRDSTEEAHPYSVFLNRLAVEESGTKLEIRRHEDCLRISGTKQHRQAFAEVLRDLAAGAIQGGSQHLHVEYYPDHSYLSESSDPVVVSKTKG